MRESLWPSYSFGVSGKHWGHSGFTASAEYALDTIETAIGDHDAESVDFLHIQWQEDADDWDEPLIKFPEDKKEARRWKKHRAQ